MDHVGTKVTSFFLVFFIFFGFFSHFFLKKKEEERYCLRREKYKELGHWPILFNACYQMIGMCKKTLGLNIKYILSQILDQYFEVHIKNDNIL